MITTLEIFDGFKHAELPLGFDVEGFRQYLNEVWQNRPLILLEGDDEEQRRNTKQRFFEINGHTIRARNYVGFVQYGNLRINIYPRVFSEQRTDPYSAIQHLYKWLSYGYRVHFPFTALDAGMADCEDWMEALIYLFASFTLTALNTSPHFAYEETTEEMAFIRGRISIPGYVKNNLSTGRHQLIYCAYEPFIYDNLFNRIVKHTSRLLLKCTKESRTAGLLEQILFTLDEVSETYCTAADCDKVKINRLFPETDNIRNLCRLFLYYQQTDTSNYRDNHLCLLLPMEVIFEEYIAGFIQTHFPQFHVQKQASGEYLAKNDNGQDVFQMKHDILIPNKTIIDTKYKFRAVVDNKIGVSQNDLYQMVAYCYKRQMTEGMLLYPLFAGSEMQRKSVFLINDLRIEVHSIDITEPDITQFDTGQKKKFSFLLHQLMR